MHAFLVQKSLLLTLLTLMTISQVHAVGDPISPCAEDQENASFSSPTSSSSSVTPASPESSQEPSRHDQGFRKKLGIVIGQKPQKIHLDSQERSHSEREAFFALLNSDKRHTTPWTPEQIIDYQRFVGCRHRVRSLGGISTRDSEESQVTVQDYNPDGYFFNGKMKERGANIRVVGYRTYYDLAPLEWEATDYEKDQWRLKCPSDLYDVTRKWHVMIGARKALKAELTRIMEDRLKLVKMVEIDYYRRRLRADTPEALILKMNKVMQPEQAYEIHEIFDDWDPYKGQYRGSYLAVILNRPNVLIARLPDSGAFHPAGRGGSFRRGDHIIQPDASTDPGKNLPVNPGHWKGTRQGDGYSWKYQGHGGNYRQGAHFNVASVIKPDPGLLAPAAHLGHSRWASHDHGVSVLLSELQSAPGVSHPSSHRVEGMTQQESLRRERRAIAAYVDEQGLISTRRGTYQGYINQYQREIEKDRALRSRDISIKKGFDNGNRPYRRGYHDNIASTLLPDPGIQFPTRYGTGMIRRMDLFNVPKEDPRDGPIIRGWYGHYLRSFQDSNCLNASFDPGKLEPVTGECYAWRSEYSPDGKVKWVQQRAGDSEYFRPGYQDNFAPAYTSDPGRTLPIGEAPTEHFSRPAITVADLNAVIARFKHVELIGE